MVLAVNEVNEPFYHQFSGMYVAMLLHSPVGVETF